MKFIYFEMKKSWLKPLTLVLILVFTVINVYKISQVFIISNTKQYGEEFIRNSKFNLYDKLKGEVNDEKIEFIKKNSEQLSKEVDGFAFSREYDDARYTGYIFGDYNLFNSDLKSDFRYIVMYPNLTLSVLQKSKDNISFYKEYDNIYEVRKNQLIYNTYTGRNLDSYYLTQGSEEYFKYDFSSLLILMLVIFYSCQLFTHENESGMSMIISTTIKGKYVAWAKLFSMMIFCILITLYFLIVDLLAINSLYNLEGLSEPLYSLKSFSLSPYNCSVMSMIFRVNIIRCLAYICLSAIVMFISYISRRSIVSIIASFTCIAGLLYIEEVNSSIINPVTLLSIRKYLYNFNYINILNYPISAIQVAICATVLVCLIIISMLFYLNRRKMYV